MKIRNSADPHLYSHRPLKRLIFQMSLLIVSSRNLHVYPIYRLFVVWLLFLTLMPPPPLTSFVANSDNMSLISNFRRVLSVVCFLLGSSPATEIHTPTFRNTLFHLHRRVGMKNQLVCVCWSRPFFCLQFAIFLWGGEWPCDTDLDIVTATVRIMWSVLTVAQE